MITLVLNLGLKTTRCIAFSFDGQVLMESSRHIETCINNERVEQNPEEWKMLTWEVTKEVTSKLGSLAKDIQNLTVTTSASCLVIVDEKGNSLGNSLLVSDTRAIKEAQILDSSVEFQKVQKITGTKSSPDLMLPKLMWLSKNEPELFSKAAHFLNADSYFIQKLTGKYITDINNALKFHYMISENSYPVNLLDTLGIELSALPEVQLQGSTVGTVLPVVAEELGMPKSCKIILSTYDALSAVVGNGTFNLGDAADISGTVTSFRAVTNQHLFDRHQRIYVTPHIGKNRWLAGGSNNLGGGLIEWVKQLFYNRESNPYKSIESSIKGLEPCPGGLIFLPYLLGERAPIWNPDCRGVFFGLNRSHGKSHMTCAVLESVGFSILHIAKVLKEYQISINSVTASGGLSRLGLVNQLKADILGLPIRKLDNFEATAIGAAIIALVGIGYYQDEKEAFQQFCKIERIYEPNLANHAIYEEYFQIYSQVYDCLRPAYILRAELLSTLNQKGVNELILTENL